MHKERVMLDWITLDKAVKQGEIATTVNADELFELTRGTVFTTISNTLERFTGRLKKNDILMIVDTFYDRLLGMPQTEIAKRVENSRDIMNFVHGLAEDTTMECIRALHYPTMSFSRILIAMGADIVTAQEVVDAMDNPFNSTQRTVLMMRHAEGLSVDDTASMLGVSTNEIRTIENQAMAALAGRCNTAPAPATLQ